MALANYSHSLAAVWVATAKDMLVLVLVLLVRRRSDERRLVTTCVEAGELLL